MKKKDHKIINKNKWFLIAIVIASVFMSIGYATVNSVTVDLTGSANAYAVKDVFIYDASIDSSSPADVFESNISIMYSTMMQSRVVLNQNSSSTLTMNITIYNKSDGDVYFDQVVYGDNFYDNNNIDYTLSGLTQGQRLGVNENVSFTITFKYTDQYKATNPSTFDNVLNSYLNFRFVKGYTITYNGFGSNNNLPTVLLENETKNITFTSTNGIPYDVSVTGCTASYTSPTLTLSNVSANVVVSRIFSITYSGFTGSTSGLTNIMGVDGGTITFNSTTGIPNSVTVTGATGSYNSPTLTISNITDNIVITGTFDSGVNHDTTTTTYNHNNLTPGTITVFDNIPGKPRVEVDDNGKVISFEYTDVGSGVSFTSGNSIDTGVDAFDNSGYTIHLKFTMDPYDNTGDMILSAMQRQNGNKYKGFSLNVYSGSRINLYANTNGTNINNNAFGTLLNSFNLPSGEQTYEFDMTYTPSPNKAITATLTPNTSGSPYTATTNHLSYYPDTLNDSSIVLGGNIANHNKDIESMTVLEFSITKN